RSHRPARRPPPVSSCAPAGRTSAARRSGSLPTASRSLHEGRETGQWSQSKQRAPAVTAVSERVGGTGRVPEPVSKLILWDIDHTLIETGGVGSEVFKDAFEQVTGQKINQMADVTGRTEQVIFAETLHMYGIEDPGDYFPKFVEAQAAGYRA